MGFHVIGKTQVKADSRVGVILDLAEDERPPYVVCGRTWCAKCQRRVWIGVDALKLLLAGGAMPICNECGAQFFTPDRLIGYAKDLT